MSAEKCSIQWGRPAEDGGAQITHYVVEKRETTRLSWVSVHDCMEHTSCTVPRLVANNEYVFRVAAVNKYGRGPALESSPLVAKNQFGM